MSDRWAYVNTQMLSGQEAQLYRYEGIDDKVPWVVNRKSEGSQDCSLTSLIWTSGWALVK